MASEFDRACAIDEESRMVCWGTGIPDEAKQPKGEFGDVTLGWSETVCALDTEGRVHCWGEEELGPETPGNEGFVRVYAFFGYMIDSAVCGFGPNGELSCSTKTYGRSEPRFVRERTEVRDIQVDALGSCRLAKNGSISCGGDVGCYDLLGSYKCERPKGQFDTIAMGCNHLCGLSADGLVTCWGMGVYGPSTTPP